MEKTTLETARLNRSPESLKLWDAKTALVAKAEGCAVLSGVGSGNLVMGRIIRMSTQLAAEVVLWLSYVPVEKRT